MSETKDCPFCGGISIDEDLWFKCDNCGAEVEDSKWNDRPVEDALRADINSLMAKIAELEKENKFYKQYFDDVGDDMECLPECDSYGHSADCPYTEPMAAFRKLRERITKLEKEKAEFVGFVKAHFKGHYECEDCWYSCPKSEGCCQASYDDVPIEERTCDCGYDKAKALLAKLEPKP